MTSVADIKNRLNEFCMRMHVIVLLLGKEMP